MRSKKPYLILRISFFQDSKILHNILSAVTDGGCWSNDRLPQGCHSTFETSSTKCTSYILCSHH